MRLSNSFTSLGDEFYHINNPTPVSNPRLFLWNGELAKELHLSESLCSDNVKLAAIFSGNEAPESSMPLSMAYAGHQFGHFSPQLGDGRAHLLGEIETNSGRTLEVQLKGSGTSRFSRGGDGRCAQGPAIREFVMSEAMHALGIPTTRALAVVTTGEQVFRDTPVPGAVVTRVATSHLRVGTFEYFAAQGNYNAVRDLAHFAIQRHFPDIDFNQTPNCYVQLIEHALDRQIDLVVQWMRVGFIHGVMNTDNTTISGETIDYGPCAFMGAYDPATVYSSIDTQGRYSFGNQPAIIQWNISRFAECFIPLIDKDSDAAIDQIRPIFEAFPDKFESAFMRMMGLKLGISNFSDKDKPLLSEFLTQMKKHKMDYTITFDKLGYSLTSTTLSGQLSDDFEGWLDKWKLRLDEENEDSNAIQSLMRRNNPVVIPRNHHMENVISSAIESKDPSAALDFLKVLKTPYEVSENTHLYQDQPSDGDAGYQTFCGT